MLIKQIVGARLERKFEILDWEGTAKFTENGKVFSDVKQLREHLSDQDTELKIVAVSGGFDPIHIGHIRYIQAAAKIAGENGVLVVIANKDSWLRRKKGFAFMGESERMEILASIKGVDYVIPWDDGTPNVAECLRVLKPHVFANGGDRNSIENVPEYPVCQEIDCAMIFGAGGGKIQSSSDLLAQALEADAEGRRVAREDRLRALGFEEVTAEQRKENLALNVALCVDANEMQRRAPEPYRKEVLQQFEGTIHDVQEDTFTARLRDLTAQPPTDEWITFDLSEVAEADRHRVEEGAVFYWNLGRMHHYRGMEMAYSELVFRTLPLLSRRGRSVLSEGDPDLDDLFGFYDALQRSPVHHVLQVEDLISSRGGQSTEFEISEVYFSDKIREATEESLGADGGAPLSDERMQFVANALELRAFRLLDGDDAEALRHAAVQAFQVARSLPRGSLPLDAAAALVRVSCLGVLGGRGADVRRLLLDEGLPVLPVDASDWGTRVSASILDMWLRLFRKQGWEDLDAIQQRVASLRADQRAYEPTFLALAEERKDARPAWELMSQYHLAKAAEILGVYLSQGSVEGHYDIREQLEAQFDRAIAAANRGQLMAQEALARLLARTARVLVDNSIWTVT